MLQARPHAIHFKRILDFGEGQAREKAPNMSKQHECHGCASPEFNAH
jgi:hypothetical protein